MKYPHLIILYGRFGDKVHEKQQAMIDGRSTCGYRSYAKAFGEIIYLCPQVTKETWDSSISSPHGLLKYIKARTATNDIFNKETIIWSVKHDPTGQKDAILQKIPNKNRLLFMLCLSYY